MSFKRIFYDAKSNKIHHWYVDEDGVTRREDVRPEIEYYVKDTTGLSETKDIYGNSVKRMVAKNKYDLKHIKEMMTTHEAEISEDTKFLQKRYGNQKLKVDISKFQIATIDIEVECFKFPDPSVAEFPINLITIHLSKQNETYSFGLHPYTGDSATVMNYRYCVDEVTLLKRFISLFRKAKIDILTGWFSKGFDVPYIIKRCENLGIENSLSPIDIYKEKNKSAGYHVDGGGYEIAGIATLDGMDLYKNFEREKRQSYSLNAIGMIEVNEGKLDFEGTINDLWRTDWNKYVEYNVQDVLLTKKINDKKRYIELAIIFCYQALVPFEKVFSSINLVTGYIIRFLHKKNIVLPDKNKNLEVGDLPGAFVMAKCGMYKYCMNFDVESMYPHLIMRYNISPETIVMFPEDTTGLISSPIEGVYFRKDKEGILPQIVGSIFAERKHFKNKQNICALLEDGTTDCEEIAKNTKMPLKQVKELLVEIEEEGESESYYDSQQYIRKILANATYGDVANRHFVFYNLNNAKVVTTGGQTLIKFLSKCINDYFFQNVNSVIKMCFPNENYKSITLKEDVVILIDTDSNYLCFDEIITKLGIQFKDNKEFREWCITLNEKFFDPFFDKILKIFFDRYNIDKTINFKKEKIISQMAILAMKKYAIEVVDNEGKFFETPRLKFTGIEIVRTDTPLFCRKRLKEVIQEIFDTKDRDIIIERMRKIYDEYMNADVNDIAIAKGVKEYDKYAQPIEHYIQNGLSYVSRIPIQARVSMNYNYMIEKYEMPYIPITNGTKMKFFYVQPNNILHQNAVGFINKWPKEFDKYFVIDKDMMWEKTFKATIQRFFEVLNWGNFVMDGTAMDEFDFLTVK